MVSVLVTNSKVPDSSPAPCNFGQYDKKCFFSSFFCMYVILLTPRRAASYFERFPPFTHTTTLINRCQPVRVGFSGRVLVRASLGISIGRTAILVVRTPYIWSYVSVLCLTGETSVPGIEPETCLPVFWSPHQGAGPFLLDLQF